MRTFDPTALTSVARALCRPVLLVDLARSPGPAIRPGGSASLVVITPLVIAEVHDLLSTAGQHEAAHDFLDDVAGRPAGHSVRRRALSHLVEAAGRAIVQRRHRPDQPRVEAARCRSSNRALGGGVLGTALAQCELLLR